MSDTIDTQPPQGPPTEEQRLNLEEQAKLACKEIGTLIDGQLRIPTSERTGSQTHRTQFEIVVSDSPVAKETVVFKHERLISNPNRVGYKILRYRDSKTTDPEGKKPQGSSFDRKGYWIEIGTNKLFLVDNFSKVVDDSAHLHEYSPIETVEEIKELMELFNKPSNPEDGSASKPEQVTKKHRGFFSRLLRR